jgi:hypothetical protein
MNKPATFVAGFFYAASAAMYMNEDSMISMFVWNDEIKY